jgi:hypothetical protein
MMYKKALATRCQPLDFGLPSLQSCDRVHLRPL